MELTTVDGDTVRLSDIFARSPFTWLVFLRHLG